MGFCRFSPPLPRRVPLPQSTASASRLAARKSRIYFGRAALASHISTRFFRDDKRRFIAANAPGLIGFFFPDTGRKRQKE